MIESANERASDKAKKRNGLWFGLWEIWICKSHLPVLSLCRLLAFSLFG